MTSAEDIVMKGELLLAQFEYEKARKALEMAVEMAPDDPAILDHLAETYLALELPEKARQTWEKFLDMYHKYRKEQKPGGMGREDKESQRIQKKLHRLENGGNT